MLKINNKDHHFMYFHWRNDGTLSRMSVKYIIEHQTKLSRPPLTCITCRHKYANIKTQDPVPHKETIAAGTELINTFPELPQWSRNTFRAKEFNKYA